MYKRTVGERIRELRIAQGMSQQELGEKIGFKDRTSINKIELDLRGLPLDKLVDLARVLGVSPNYIMGWEEPAADPELARLEDVYRSMSRHGREELLRYAEYIAPQHKKDTASSEKKMA